MFCFSQNLRPIVAQRPNVFRKIEDIQPQIGLTVDERVQAGVYVEGHGDLWPEHICLTDKPFIYECLEFNRTLRLTDPYSELSSLGLERAVLGADWIGPYLIDTPEPELGPRPGHFLMAVHATLHTVLRARLCLAHLLQENPRTLEKWPPLGKCYLDFADRRLDQSRASSRMAKARTGTVETS